jgi:hypothetical protein
MHKLNLIIYVLTLMFILNGLNLHSQTITEVKPGQLPPCSIKSINKIGIKGKLEYISFGPRGLPRWSNLQKADILINFKKPVQLPTIGIIRFGWKGWSIPHVIGISVNGKPEKRYELKSPRTKPMGKGAVKCDLINLDSQPIKSLRVRVISASAEYNRHGTFKIVEPKSIIHKQTVAKVKPKQLQSKPVTKIKPEQLQNLTVAKVKPKQLQSKPVTKIKPEQLQNLTVAEVKPGQLPPCRVTSMNKFVPKGKLEYISCGPRNLPFWSDLRKADLLIKFKKPEKLPEIGIVRFGWDWAIPHIVGITINDQAEKYYKLKSPRTKPMGKGAVKCDLINLSSQPIKSLRVRVISINTKSNRHGTFKIVVPKYMPQTQKLLLPATLPTHAAGIRISLNCPQPVKNAMLKAWAYRFRRDISWSIPLQKLPVGKSEIICRWDDFISSASPNVKLTPQNLYKLELKTATHKQLPKIVKWEFINDPNIHNLPPWQQLPQLSFLPDEQGWRPGIPTNGFGRFGYIPNNGILVGNISPNHFIYNINDSEGEKSIDLKIACGGANELAWRRFKVNWTGVTMTQQKKHSGDKVKTILSKAYGIFDQTRLPEDWIYSMLVPGFLLKSHDKLLTINPDNKNGSPWLLFHDGQGVKWKKLDSSFSGKQLQEGWCILIWKNSPKLPILLTLSHQPDKIVSRKSAVSFIFANKMDYIGFGTPAGFRGWNGKLGKINQQTKQLVKNSKKLAGILRAYPRTSVMRFLDGKKHIRFQESFSYICWNNDWNEKWEKVAPVSPLLVFAKQNGYPVKWPQGAPASTGIDTKYGPYCVWSGKQAAFAEYTLPLPPLDTTIYPRPKGSVLADKVAEAITKNLGTFKANPDRFDSLRVWWMYAPSSLALPLLSENQREQILSVWKKSLKLTFASRPWYVRTEPYSGSKYLISFAWINNAREILGDPNSGIGAALYGAWAYARSSGDWKTIVENWDAMQGAIRFFLVCHTWTNMQTACREHTGSSAIDMDGIGYEGALGFLQMAEALNKNDDAAMARMLLSRLALSTVSRLWGMRWRYPNLPSEKWNAFGMGFSEGGFDLLNNRRGGPDFVNSELALTLSWAGQYPVLYDLHIWGAGKPFWNFLEYNYLENKIENWRKKHKGRRNWHDANICAHLYMRARLGESQKKLKAELEKQFYGKRKWFFSPDPRLACENAAFYALYLGQDIPVRLKNWGRLALIKAEYDANTRRAHLAFRGDRPDFITLEILRPAISYSINGQKRNALSKGDAVKLEVPAGESTVELFF